MSNELNDYIVASCPTCGRGNTNKIMHEIIHKGTTQHDEYLKARFADMKSGLDSFFYAGHRWKYAHDSFDDLGDYAVIYRWVPEKIKESNNA